jgi:uncharacterized membrane protein HdeD (DUF308 family)
MEDFKTTGELSVIERLSAPTPKFFKQLRTIGLVLAAVGGVLVTAPVMLPTIVVTIGGYLIVAGGVASAVSQAAVGENGENKKKENMK